MKIEKNIKFQRFSLIVKFVLITMIFLSTASCDEYQAQEFITTNDLWVGVVQDEQAGPIRVELTLKSQDGQTNTVAYSLHYGVPRSCRLDAEEIMKQGTTVTLKVKTTSGGFCDQLYQGVMAIDKENSSTWSTSVEKPSIRFKENFILTINPT